MSDWEALKDKISSMREEEEAGTPKPVMPSPPATLKQKGLAALTELDMPRASPCMVLKDPRGSEALGDTQNPPSEGEANVPGLTELDMSRASPCMVLKDPRGSEALGNTQNPPSEGEANVPGMQKEGPEGVLVTGKSTAGAGEVPSKESSRYLPGQRMIDQRIKTKMLGSSEIGS